MIITMNKDRTTITMNGLKIAEWDRELTIAEVKLLMTEGLQTMFEQPDPGVTPQQAFEVYDTTVVSTAFNQYDDSQLRPEEVVRRIIYTYLQMKKEGKL